MKMSQINEEPEEDKELEKQFSTENKVEESQEGEKNSIVNMHATTQDQAIEKIHMRVRSAIKGECFVRYDLFNYDDDDESIDNLDEIAIQGKVRAIDEIYDSYVSEVLNNPTWLELTIEANNMIISSKDHHHRYFEGIEVLEETSDGIKVLSLILGS